MTNSLAFQITSNELAHSILGMVVQTAEQHQLEVKVSDPICFNAPFCGEEYFTQQIQLLSASGSRTHLDFDNCMREIETIVERELSEGFLETQ